MKEQPVVIAAEVIAQPAEPVTDPVPEPAVEPAADLVAEPAAEPVMEPESIVVEEHIEEVQSLPQTAVEPEPVAVVQTEVVETAVQPEPVAEKEEPVAEKEEPVAEKVEERPAPQRQTRRVVRKVQRKKQPFEFSLGAFASSSVDAPITFGIAAETKTAEVPAPASVMTPVTPVTPATPVNPVTAASTVSAPAAQPTNEGRGEEEA